MVESESSTNSTLLARLRDEPTASRSWDEFVARYGPRIVNWCQKWGLQPADAADVAQNVLLELSQQMKKFRYDPDKRFRSWLKTVTRRAWYDYSQRRKKRETHSLDETPWLAMDTSDAQEDLCRRLDEECQREMLEIAIDRVKTRVVEHTWSAFEMTELQGISATEVAAQLDINIGTVYVARGRVQRLIVEEVAKLDTMDDE